MARARIVSVDTAEARALSGVVAVLTAADLNADAGSMQPTILLTDPANAPLRPLAETDVRFVGDAVAIVMADGSDDPRDVVTYYRLIEQGFDCAFGSRFVPGSVVYDYPRFKLVLNRMVNLGIRLLFRHGYNDTTNAFKAYRREVIDNNKAWRAAEPVRREYIRNLLARKTPPKGALRFVTAEIVGAPDLVGDGKDELLADLLSKPTPTQSWGRAVGAAAVANATETRLPLLLLAQVAADREQTMNESTWRSVHPTAARWLAFLAATGYTLAPVEQKVVDAAAADPDAEIDPGAESDEGYDDGDDPGAESDEGYDDGDDPGAEGDDGYDDGDAEDA